MFTIKIQNEAQKFLNFPFCYCSYMKVIFLASLNTLAPPVLFRSDGENDLEKMREFQQLTGQQLHQRTFMTAT
jgi:hypothetical protein